MRRIIYSIAMSLDGFIAGPNGEYDWIPEEPEMDWDEFVGRFDLALMGRKSYDTLLDSGTKLGVEVVVFSRTLRPEDHVDVRIVSSAVREVIDEMRKMPGKDIWLFGGGELFGSLFAEGLVDCIEVGLVPALLGTGIRAFPGDFSLTSLDLESVRSCKSGMQLLVYSVPRA